MAAIQPQDTLQWLQLRDQIKDLERLNLPAVRASEEAKKAQLEATLHNIRKETAKLQKTATKEEHRLHDMQHKTATHFFHKMTGHLNEKIAHEQEKLSNARGDLGAKQEMTMVHQGQLDTVNQTLARVAADEERLAQLKRARDGLVASVFDGPSGAGDVRERQLQSEVAMLRPEMEVSQARANKYEHARKHFNQGLELCRCSLVELSQVRQMLGTDMMMDVFDGGRGGMFEMMYDMERNQRLRQSVMDLHRAADEIVAAKKYVPEIVPIDPHLVKTMDPFLNMMFENIMTDMIMRRQVSDSVLRIERTYTHLVAASAWLDGELAVAQSQATEATRRYEARANQLQAHRWQLLDLAPCPPTAPLVDFGETAPSAPPAPANYGYDPKMAGAFYGNGQPSAPPAYAPPAYGMVSDGKR